jgi:hypothetical protein
MHNLDLCHELVLTDEELESNKQPLQIDTVQTFDPNFTLSNIESGFPIFAFEDSLNEVPAWRMKLAGEIPSLMTVFLHAHIQHAGEFSPTIKLSIQTETDTLRDSEIITLTFDRQEIPLTFSSALLGGLLRILKNIQRNVPLPVCSSSDFLSRMLVQERIKSTFHLLKSVFATERTAQIEFKKKSLIIEQKL